VISCCIYKLAFNNGNRLPEMSDAIMVTFEYGGDGNRVKGTVGGVTITYIGNYYEWSGSTATCRGRSVLMSIISKIMLFTNIIMEAEKGSDLPLQHRVGMRRHTPGQYLGSSQQQRGR
jgi:hypothetical protein